MVRVVGGQCQGDKAPQLEETSILGPAAYQSSCLMMMMMRRRRTKITMTMMMMMRLVMMMMMISIQKRGNPHTGLCISVGLSSAAEYIHHTHQVIIIAIMNNGDLVFHGIDDDDGHDNDECSIEF